MTNIISNKSAVALLGVSMSLALTGCADFDDWNYDVEKPQTIAQYEYLNNYETLKSYAPGFKVGAGITVDEFNAKGVNFRLAAHNFDEVVAGNAMKMASCVSDLGVMDFDKVGSFVTAAEDAGVSIFGHTLAWHSQQPVKWLSKLIADKELDVDPDAKIEEYAGGTSYKDMADGAFPHYPMGCEPPIQNGALHFEPTGNWSQFFCSTGNSLKAGEYVVKVRIKSSKEGAIKLTLQNGWGSDAENITLNVSLVEGWSTAEIKTTLEQGGNYDAILKPETFDAVLDLESVEFYTLSSPAVEMEQEVKYHTYTDGPFPYYVMGCAPEVINGAMHFVPTGDWSQFFCLPGGDNPLSDGDYVIYVEIKSSKAGTIKLTAQNGWGGDAENVTMNVSLVEGWTTAKCKATLEQGGNYDFILKPETFDATIDLKSITIKKVVKMNAIPLTDQEKKDTLTWAMNKWVNGMMQACDSKVKAWDLINEAISGGGNVEGYYDLQHFDGYATGTWDVGGDAFYWQDYLGSDEYGPIVEKAAREAYVANGGNAADLKLFINDYNLESDWDQNQKLKSLIYWMNKWEAKGKELGYNTNFDGIGTQMHISYYENETTQNSKKAAIENMFKLMAATGKLVRVSELDMGYVDAEGKDVTTAQIVALPIEERVAKEKAMADYYTWIIKKYKEIVPAAQQYGITQWCLTDSPADSGWRGGQPVGLWNNNLQRKPAYGGWAEGLKK